MYLEEALERIDAIIKEVEGKNLPLHEVMALHEEGKKLVAFSEKLLSDAKNRLKVTEVGIDSEGDSGECAPPQKSDDSSGPEEISLF